MELKHIKAKLPKISRHAMRKLERDNLSKAVKRGMECLRTIVRNNKRGAKFKTSLPVGQFDVFMKRGRGLYMWVWESQYKAALRGEVKLIPKFGQYGTKSLKGTTPQKTIEGYLGTMTEAVVILWAINFEQIEFSDDIDKKLFDENSDSAVNPYKVEQAVRATLLSDGVRIFEDGTNTELYECSPNHIIENVNNLLYGTKKRLSFVPRKRQREFMNKIKLHKQTGGYDFLLAAIMRYGKNFSWLTANYELINEGFLKKGSVFLVLTSKPKVFKTLKDDIEGHVYYKDWDYIELKGESDRTPSIVDGTKPTVIAVSTQLAYNKKSGKKVREFLKQFHFSDVFIDECHSGTNTENFLKLEEIIKTDHRTWASGTPIKTYVMRGFIPENTYFYGYIDQQEDKKRDLELGIPNDSVTLKTYTMSIPDDIKNDPRFTEDEQFNIKKLLATDSNGKFVFEGDVERAMLGILEGKAQYSPFRIVSNLNHTAWLLPGDSVSSATALCKMLERLTDDDTKIVNATGNNVTDIDDVLTAINNYEKTITITIGRFVEGATVKPWTATFVLSNTKSAEEYFQFIFRTASPMEGKKYAYVFDFSPERSFMMVFEMAKAIALLKGESDIKKIVKQWLECNPIFKQSTGPNFEEVDISDIMNQINDGDYRSQSLHSSAKSWINMENLGEVVDEFVGKDLKASKSVSKKFIENGMEGGKNYTVDGKRKGNPTEKEVNEFQKVFENVAVIVSSFPFLADLYEVKTVSELLQSVDEEAWLEATKCGSKSIQMLLDKNVINEFEVNFYL